MYLASVFSVYFIAIAKKCKLNIEWMEKRAAAAAVAHALAQLKPKGPHCLYKQCNRAASMLEKLKYIVQNNDAIM